MYIYEVEDTAIFSFILRKRKCLVSAMDVVAGCCFKILLLQVRPGPAVRVSPGIS